MTIKKTFFSLTNFSYDKNNFPDSRRDNATCYVVQSWHDYRAIDSNLPWEFAWPSPREISVLYVDGYRPTHVLLQSV